MLWSIKGLGQVQKLITLNFNVNFAFKLLLKKLEFISIEFWPLNLSCLFKTGDLRLQGQISLRDSNISWLLMNVITIKPFWIYPLHLNCVLIIYMFRMNSKTGNLKKWMASKPNFFYFWTVFLLHLQTWAVHWSSKNCGGGGVTPLFANAKIDLTCYIYLWWFMSFKVWPDVQGQNNDAVPYSVPLTYFLWHI